MTPRMPHFATLGQSTPRTLCSAALTLLVAAFSCSNGANSQRSEQVDAAPTSPTSAHPTGTAAAGMTAPTAPSVASTIPPQPVTSNPPTPPTTSATPSVPVADAGAAPPSEGPPPSNSTPASDGGLDAPSVEAGVTDDDCPPFEMPEACTVPDGGVLPADLHCTGLYEAWPGQQPRCDVVEYAPAFELWSDGAVKRRFVHIPRGTQVDVTDSDAFLYPVGTRFWKEFQVLDGDRLRLGETRLMQRVELGWLYTSYVWSEDGQQAVQENAGVLDLHGTGHSVPSREDCKTCHSGRSDFILGWDALMLGDGASGITHQTLEQADWVTWEGKSEGVPSPLDLRIPGDLIEQAALGYLHSNCGISCHNDNVSAEAYDTGLFLQLDSDALASVQQTPTFATALLRPHSPNATISDLPALPDGRDYVALRPLDTEGSLLLARMKIRGSEAAMPRLGTNVVDEVGVGLVQAWIEQMTPERGYPEAAVESP